MNVAELLVVTDYFVICTGRNDRQVKTIADEIEERLRVEAGIKPLGREGLPEAKWVLLDFIDVVVHVFQPEERDFYRLEKLWGEAPRLALPEDVTGPVSPPASAASGIVDAGSGPEDEACETGDASGVGDSGE